MRLTELPRPFVVCVLTDATAAETVATMRHAVADGADAFECNLPFLADEASGSLEELFCAPGRPVYTSARRHAFLTVYGQGRRVADWSDDERMRRQLEALRHGAVALDMELDTYDPHPAFPPRPSPDRAGPSVCPPDLVEMTDDPMAVAHQKDIVAEAHRLGGEVIASCHTGIALPPDAALAIGQRAEARGADLFKLIVYHHVPEDLTQTVATCCLLRQRLAIPFTVAASGSAGRPTRIVAPLLGAAWALGQQQFVAGGFHDQPLVRSLRGLFIAAAGFHEVT